MIIRFCTKRNVNGHRKYLIIDTSNKSYNDQNNRMGFIRSDFVQVSATELKKLKCQAQVYYTLDPALY